MSPGLIQLSGGIERPQNIHLLDRNQWIVREEVNNMLFEKEYEHSGYLWNQPRPLLPPGHNAKSHRPDKNGWLWSHRSSNLLLDFYTFAFAPISKAILDLITG